MVKSLARTRNRARAWSFTTINLNGSCDNKDPLETSVRTSHLNIHRKFKIVVSTSLRSHLQAAGSADGSESPHPISKSSSSLSIRPENDSCQLCHLLPSNDMLFLFALYHIHRHKTTL